MKVEMLKHPTDEDWMEVKRRALVTIGKKPVSAPNGDWKKAILEARHSPIRYMMFSFYLEVPYWVAMHLCRHTHSQPYVKSQRNDRQSDYDRTKAPQDAVVSMIWDLNAEELITVANKRLCKQAAQETQDAVRLMCDEVIKTNPEFKSELVPMCVREGCCHEMNPCTRSSVE